MWPVWGRTNAAVFCLAGVGFLGACVASPSDLLGTSSGAPSASASRAAASRLDDRFRDLGGSEPTSGANYQLGPADVIHVSVFQVAELNVDAQVSAEGDVVLPLVGRLRVEGKQGQDVEREIAAKLRAKYLRSPQVGVFVKNYNSQKIVVSGAVMSPGTFPMTSDTTLTSAIADAKGLTDVADQHTVAVFRNVNGQKFAARLDLDEVAKGAIADIRLRKGDVVVVDTSDWKYGLKTYLPMATYGSIFTRL